MRYLIITITSSIITHSASMAQALKIGFTISPTLRAVYYKSKTEFKKPWGNVTGDEYALMGWDAGIRIEKPLKRWGVATGVYISLNDFQHGPVTTRNVQSNKSNSITNVINHFVCILHPHLIQ